jgi:ligand-binding sensor domain-containing protein/signal transduction histidine kinase
MGDKYILKNIIVLIFIFAFLETGLLAQSVKFEYLIPIMGLSHSQVICSVQDKLGFMWFGTFDGLNKFDGYNFTIYRHNQKDTTSIINNMIQSIYEDREGNLWLRTWKGLSLYDRIHDNFITIDENNSFIQSPLNIGNVYQDRHGNYWCTTANQGLIYYNPRNKNQTLYTHQENDPNSIASNNIRVIFEDSEGGMWFATYQLGLDRFNDSTRAFTHFKNQKGAAGSIIGNDVYAIVEDKEHFLWFACYGDGLSRIQISNVDQQSFTNYQQDAQKNNGLSSNFIRSLYPDKDQGLWIGTENGGLDYLNEAKKTFVHFKNEKDDLNSLNNNSIYSICQDNNGDLWIGTFAGGVNVLHHSKQAFKQYRHIPYNPYSLSYNSVWKFAEDQEGNIWIATDGGGLNKFNPETGKIESFTTKNTNLNKDAVLTVYVDVNNNIWIGTWTGGFSKFNPKTKSFLTFTTANSALRNNNVFDITGDSRGNLWLATKTGIHFFNPKSQTFEIFSVNNSQAEVISTDSKGNLLIGSVDGFSIYDPDKKECTYYNHDPDNDNSISDDFITSIFEQDSVTLWISTINGFNKLDRKSNQITRYFKSDGLPDDLVSGIEKDDNGFLWISTNSGLSRFDATAGKFRNFTIEDGLQGKTFIKKSHYRSKNGKMFFGGINGFNVFDPAEIVENKAVPPVVITEFQVLNKPVPIGGNSPLQENINLSREINLQYGQSSFSFTFAALNYVSPSKNQYAYMLEGFDHDWIYAGTQRKATYTNINPGEYVFRVKGSNNDGIWNEQGRSVGIIITPPFWQAWWFRFMVLFIIIGSIAAGEKIRTARIRAHNRELEQHVRERTAQLEYVNKELDAFSYSVSHDLRAPLRGMDGYSQILLDDYADKLDNQGKKYLTSIRKGSQHMGEIIDSLLKLSKLSNNEMTYKKVNLSRMVNTIAREYNEMDPERIMEFRITDNLYVQGDATLLEVMLKNLIDNAWKYTSKTTHPCIEFGKTSKDHKTVFYIRDNGLGFDSRYSSRLFEPFLRQHTEFEGIGIGLAIVQRIINRHGGRIWAEGTINHGATFYFTIDKNN